jgi:hypothetical protein
MLRLALIAVTALMPGYALAQQCTGNPPPCGPQQNWPGSPMPQGACQPVGQAPPPTGAPPTGAPPTGSPPVGAPQPQGMFVAPQQTGTTVGASQSLIYHPPKLHFSAFSLGLPAIEFGGFSRARQEAHMELNQASAPFVPMTSFPQQPQAMFAGQSFSSPPPTGAGSPSPAPPSSGAPGGQPAGASQCQPAGAAPCQPAGAAPCQPAGQAPGACPAAAPAPVRPQFDRENLPTPLPPRPTSDSTYEMQLRRMQDLERRLDVKIEQLTVLQRNLQQLQGNAEIQIHSADAPANRVQSPPQRDIYDGIKRVSDSEPRAVADDGRSGSDFNRGNGQEPNPIRPYFPSEPLPQNADASTAERLPDIRR